MSRRARVAAAPPRPALIVCDVWDTHWCATARQQADLLAPRIDDAARCIRQVGGLVVHAPSQTDHFYGTFEQFRVARALAVALPTNRPPPMIEVPRYRTCPCDPPCDPPDETKEWPWPWRRQHDAIDVGDDDLITCDHGPAVFGALQRMSSTPVAICGLHLDRCILDRPFGARALWAAGVDIVILDDLTEPTHPVDRTLVVETVAEALPVISSSAFFASVRP